MSDRAQLLQLIRTQALMKGDFVLASGRRSDYYIDARRVTLSGPGSLLVGRLVLDHIRAELPDAVGGMSMGADPIVSAVTVVSAEQGLTVDGLLVRKQSKEHGTGRRVEGPVRPGMSAVVVEDTSTTGRSALEAVAALGDSEVEVNRVVTLIDREEGAALAVQTAGLTFEAIFSVSEILSSA